MAATQGAKNMLTNCAEAQKGERLLIAYEPAEFGYYDADALPCVVGAAWQLGLTVETVNVGFCPDTPCLTPELKAQFAAFSQQCAAQPDSYISHGTFARSRTCGYP